jgi:hypothetical protein
MSSRLNVKVELRPQLQPLLKGSSPQACFAKDVFLFAP